MSAGYPKHKRLLEAADFQPVFRRTRFKVSCYRFLILATDNRRDVARLGLVVAKKNVRRAVQRNRIKRVVRERFRQFPRQVPQQEQREHIEHLNLDGLDIVVLAKQGADGLSSQRMGSKVERLFRALARKASNKRKKTP